MIRETTSIPTIEIPLKVGVIGTGHVGLITSVTLAAMGHDVVGVDSDVEKIERLQRGEAPFFEPGLQELLDSASGGQHISFSTEIAAGVVDREVVFISVGTPPRETGEANLVAVEDAAREVARAATRDLVVVEKSTVPAGTAERIRRTIALERPDAPFEIEVVSNPEFLREGTAIEDSLRPDRILIGADSPRGYAVMRRIYQGSIDAGSPVIETDIRTAELAKHASNAFLALKISYANGLARICERTGADVVAIAEVMGSDPRIGRAFLDAGLGYGGFCFPKDLDAFERLANEANYEFPLIREIQRLNDEAVVAAFQKVREGLWNIEGKRVALLGLAFKPGTDDIRFSPALALGRRLLAEGATVIGYDPQAMPGAKDDVPDLEVALDPYSAIMGVHCAVVCTEWEEFKRLDLDMVKEQMAYPLIVDGRNVFDPHEMRTRGFTYLPTGRPPVL